MIVILDCIDLDYVLRYNRLAPLTYASTVEHRVEFEKWELSNCMSLNIMKLSILEPIRGLITEQYDAKIFLK